MKILLALITTAVLASCAGTGTSGSVKRYTKDTCIVTGSKLGSMGAPITKVYGDQEVKFCCKSCVGKFEKNPQRFLKGA